MIAIPRSDIHRSQCAKMMKTLCALKHTDDTRYVCWIAGPAQRLAWCIAFEGWLGKTCRIHMARDPKASPYVPRKLMNAVFSYAFNEAKLELLFGVVRGDEEHVLRLDRWLGFEEAARFAGVHEGGHDLVVMTMRRDQCRFLGEKHGRKIRATCT